VKALWEIALWVAYQDWAVGQKEEKKVACQPD
jgi:hypothetical protein